MLLSPSCRSAHGSADNFSMQNSYPIPQGLQAMPEASCRSQHMKMVTRLTTLPQELLEHIITYADAGSRLALLRTCRQARDTVLHLQASEWGKTLRTTLSMDLQANQSAKFPYTRIDSEGPFVWCSCGHTQSVLGIDYPTLQSATGPPGMDAACSHVRCLSIDGSQHRQDSSQHKFAAELAQLRPRRQAAQPDTSAYFPVQSLLGFLSSTTLLPPWVSQRLHSIHVLVLKHVQLKQPLPECIGCACPNLKTLQLEDVIWDEGSSTVVRPWPQLQQLTINKTECLNLACYFNPTTLPNLRSLHIGCKLGSIFGRQELSSSVADCSMGFRSQLSQLSTCGVSKALQGMLANSSVEAVFPVLTTLSLATPLVQDAGLFCLLAAAPQLTHLAVQGMQLSNKRRDLTNLTCSLRHLSIAYCNGTFVTTLAGLPNMPHLQQLQLPPLYVASDQASPAEIAAAVAAVTRLPNSLAGVVKVSFGGVQYHENDLIAKLQLVSPLLLALTSKFQTIFIDHDTVTRPMLCALGAACLPHITFRWCTWSSPDLIGELCSLMPHVKHIAIKDSSMSMDSVTLLCRTVTCPVTLHLCDTLVSPEQYSEAVAREGNAFVTVRKWDTFPA